MIFALAIMVFVTTAFVWRLLMHLDKTTTPGPLPFPLIGTLYVHSIWPSPKQLQKLADIYGDLISLYFGSQRVVLINGTDYIRNVLNDNAFVDRGLAESYTFNKLLGSSDLFRSDYTPRLIHDRKLVLNAFRKLGTGKTLMEERIQLETNALSDYLIQKSASKMNPMDIIPVVTLNITLSVLVEERFMYDAKEAHDMLSTMLELSDSFLTNSIMDKIPFLCHVPPFKWHIQSLQNNINVQIETLKRFTDKAIHRYEPGRQSCFVDFWLESHGKQKETAANYCLHFLSF